MTTKNLPRQLTRDEVADRMGIFQQARDMVRWWPAILLALSFWITLAIIIF